MAKKVVATLKTADGRGFAKIIKMVKSPKTGAYTFKEQMVPNDQVKEAVKKSDLKSSYKKERRETLFFLCSSGTTPSNSPLHRGRTCYVEIL